MASPRSVLADRLAAVLGDRYAVEGEVGSGGMAIVFGARDVRHNRRVAIKVLRPELAASLGDDRFLREIELAAGLQHPHILPVYDSGAGGGLLYYVMPFVEGESLSERIARDGMLPVDETVRLAREIAGALGYAHARGIIHRDVKPDNVMLSGGHALVTDFGIARAATAPDARLTATGMAVGTPLYMSPEQALGSGDVDGRADVYSLGCVLYEMLTGRQPFSGSSLQAILAQSITAPRPRVRKQRPGAPAALDDVVTTALAKEPTDRFETAEAMDAALAGVESGVRPVHRGSGRMLAAAIGVVLVLGAGWMWYSRLADGTTGAGVATDARVIAVLPFRASGGGGAGVAGLGEGLVDLLSTNLDGVGGIRTVDPHAVLRGWRARAGAAATLDRADALAVGRALGAGSVLTGDVVTVGPRVRLSAELANVSGEVLARAQADGAADSVLALVDSLSVRLLRDVWRASSPVPELRVSALTTGSLPAMRAYLEGEAQFRRSDWAAASRSYSEAIERDSSFGLAYLRLITTYDWLGVDLAGRQMVSARLASRLGQLPARERTLAVGTMLYQRGSITAADTALALTTRYPDGIDGWMLLGETRYHARALLASSDEEVRAPFERVLALDPSRVSVYEHLLDVSAFAGDSATFSRDLTRLRGVAGADSAVAHYALIGAALWSPPPADGEAMRSLARRFDAMHAIVLKSALAVRGAVARLDDALARASGPVADSLKISRVELLLAGGRLAAARDLAADGVARLPDVQAFYYDMLMPVTTGLDGSMLPRLRAAARRFSPRPFGRLLAVEIGVATRDTALVRQTLGVVFALDSVALGPRLRAVFEVVPGWERLAAGDSVAGAAAVGAALARTDFTLQQVTAPPRFARAVALSRDPATRGEGIRLLRYGFVDDPAWFGLRQLALHEALLAAGDPGAAATGAVVASMWIGADPATRAAAQRIFPRGFTR